MPVLPVRIHIRCDKRTARQWEDAIALYRAVHKLNRKDRAAAAMLSMLLANWRALAKRKLGPNWADALARPEPEPSVLPDAGKLNPPPLTD